MNLNQLQPAEGAKRSARRVGRGFTRGKTCGRGHKGQLSRSGGKVSDAFEGGQMPLQRRLPKSGFCSRRSLVTENVRLVELRGFNSEFYGSVTVESLKSAGLIKRSTQYVKVYGRCADVTKLLIEGIRVSRGAAIDIEAQGGEVK